MSNTNPITYVYVIDGHEVAITRVHVGTAYARNGNVGNPTEYFVWEARVDGVYAVGHCRSRVEAYEYARCGIAGLTYVPIREGRPGKERNIRHYLLVADEMKANYVSRKVVK